MAFNDQSMIESGHWNWLTCRDVIPWDFGAFTAFTYIRDKPILFPGFHRIYIYRISAIFRGVRPWLPVRCPSRQSVELRFFPQAIDHSSDLHPDTLFWHSIIWKYIWLIYFDILSDFFWYSIWHIFWRSIWHLFWHSFWHVLGSMRAQTRHDSLRPTVTTTWQKTNTRRRKD